MFFAFGRLTFGSVDEIVSFPSKKVYFIFKDLLNQLEMLIIINTKRHICFLGCPQRIAFEQ
jgi:hypothetical protein